MDYIAADPANFIDACPQSYAQKQSSEKELLGHFVKVLKQRVQGFPRTAQELNFSLQMLACMRGQGWHDSIRKKRPVDETGKPIPWYTYAALEWLTPRVRQTDVVFEFGAGNSTIWFGQHAKQVIAVEHNSKWLDAVQNMMGSNVTLLLRATSGDEVTSDGKSLYLGALEDFPPGSFNIIVIDGMERIRCAQVAPSRLCDDGIIIFDNSDRPAYRPGIEHLYRQGFGRIDFYGQVAQVGTRSCTSVFSKFGTRWTTANIPLVFQGW